MAAYFQHHQGTQVSTLLLCSLLGYTLGSHNPRWFTTPKHIPKSRMERKREMEKQPLPWRTDSISNTSHFLTPRCPKLNQKSRLASKETGKYNIYLKYLYTQLKIGYFVTKRDMSRCKFIIQGLQGSLPLTPCLSL